MAPGRPFISAKRYLEAPNRLRTSSKSKAHLQNKRAQCKDRVISIVVSNPFWRRRKISAKVCKQSYKLSNDAIFSFLKELHFVLLR